MKTNKKESITLTANNSIIHNGEFTVINKLTNNHETFRIKTIKAGKFKGQRIVSHMEGSINTAEYKWFARVIDNKIVVFGRLTANKPDGKKSDEVAFGALLTDLMVNNGQRFGYKYEMKCSLNCLRCNRLLTNPTSLTTGYGLECLTQAGLRPAKTKRVKALKVAA